MNNIAWPVDHGVSSIVDDGDAYIRYDNNTGNGTGFYPGGCDGTHG